MFTPALGRAVRATGSVSAQSACSFGRPATLGAVQQAFARPSHQRRLSSSKPSTPPDGSEKRGSSSPSHEKESQKELQKATAKSQKKRPAKAPAPPARSALNIPWVPQTDHLIDSDVRMSSFFFSLHRPFNPDPDVSSIPPVATDASFDSVFKGRAQLASGLQGKRVAVLQADANVQPFDGPPKVSLDELMKGLVAFQPPPAPIPFDQVAFETPSNKTARDVSATSAPAAKRVWRTEVVVTESTDDSGERIYSATTAPMVEIQDSNQRVKDVQIRQRRLNCMRERVNKRPDMLAISVKRQRKLKMKKHKYKKLMKRTRLLRRKLDRA